MLEGRLVITDPRVEDYVLDIAELAGEPSLPKALIETLGVMEETADRLNYPIAGRYVGRTLSVFACLTGATRILDAGDSLGYAGTWLSAGAGSEATILTTCNSEENLVRAREFHRRAELTSNFTYALGRASDTLETQDEPFDLIYSDVNKGDYPKMAKLAVDRLRPGGVYIADSCLWYGKVCSGMTTRDAWTASVDQHNQWVFAQRGLFSTLIDQREGLLIAVKKRR
jgi:predicted O-methyltransferase YrrM